MKELCVRCGTETEYDVNTPINLRLYFVEGSGQLCEACWNQLWPENKPTRKSEQNDCKSEQVVVQ